MQEYQNVLVALDVYGETSAVLERAFRVAGEAAIQFVFVAYPQSSFEPYGVFLEKDYTEEITRRAKEKLAIIALRHSVADEKLHVVTGSPADEILLTAQKLNADLIVVGTHSRKGVKRLLGSTAHAVIQSAQVDVLAVRLGS